jgi:broad specificity phosphatase PhoE
LSTIYFFRHGQAGLRHDYDTLSELGRRQARLLGTYLAETRRLPFSRVIAGGMQRQQATLKEVRDMYVIAGEDFPAPEIDPAWNEFDLDGVVTAFAPQIAAHDPDFGRQWEELLAAAADVDSDLHREWTPCDTRIFAAWLGAKYPFAGESWLAFQERVRNAFRRLIDSADGNVAVFTSATPVGLSVAHALRCDAGMAPRLAGAQYNTAITSIRIAHGEPMLHTFNATPHLPGPAMLTLR